LVDRNNVRLRLTRPIARLVLIGSAAMLAAVVAAPPAWAGKQPNAEAAREHARRATIEYNLGHFDEAVTEYEAAYKLALDPAMLFNIAQAHRLGGHPERALAAYKAYLRTAPPGARGRKQAEKWRDELERAHPTPAAPAGEAPSDTAGASPTGRTPTPFAPPPTGTAAPAPAASPVATPPAPPARASEAPPPAAPAAGAPTAPASAAPETITPSPASTITAGPVVSASATPGQPAVAAVERERQRPADGDTAPSPGLSILEIELGPRFLTRSFQYASSAAAPSSYRLDVTPVVGARLSLFPAAREKGLLGHLGLLAAVEAATWMRSGVFPTGTSDVVVGVQQRVPMARGQISASIAYFRHALLLKDTPDPNDQRRLTLDVPNTTYVGARFGLGGRLNLGDRVVLGLDAGYRWVINPGQGPGLVRSSEYFPDADVSYALDAAASVGVRFSWWQARVGLDHRRYAFGALRGSTLSAPGATDAYTALSLSVLGEFGAADRRP
jgi:tetratricopeptide (TPR) repeat protein